MSSTHPRQTLTFVPVKHGPERGCARADYFFNSTSPPTGEEKFVATKTKVLFNISGSQEAPVKDITIRGLETVSYTHLTLPTICSV